MSGQNEFSDHPLLTVEKAAERLQLSRNTLNNWMSQGKLKRCKIGGRTFIKREEVEQILAKAME